MPRRSAPTLDAIVERVFDLRRGRKQAEVHVRFGQPRRDGDHHFVCPYRIEGLVGKPIAKEGTGIDGVHALDLAMQGATYDLLASSAYQSGRLTYLGSHDLRLRVAKGNDFLLRWDLEARRVAREHRTGSSRGGDRFMETLAEATIRPLTRPADAPFVVERALELRDGGAPTPVFVRFRQPVLHRHGYACAFQIDGLLDEKPARTAMLGADSVDALENAMKLAMMYILPSDAYQRGDLTWNGKHDLGLPVGEEVSALVRRDLDARRHAEIMTHRQRPPARTAVTLGPELQEVHREFQEELARARRRLLRRRKRG